MVLKHLELRCVAPSDPVSRGRWPWLTLRARRPGARSDVPAERPEQDELLALHEHGADRLHGVVAGLLSDMRELQRARQLERQAVQQMARRLMHASSADGDGAHAAEDRDNLVDRALRQVGETMEELSSWLVRLARRRRSSPLRAVALLRCADGPDGTGDQHGTDRRHGRPAAGAFPRRRH